MWTTTRTGYECLATTLRDIETCTVGRRVGICNKQLFSSYYLTGMNSAISVLPKESSILCVGYCIGDMQFTVTGSCYKDETVQDAAIREVKEELGVDIDITKLKLHSHGAITNDKKKSTIFTLCIDNCEMRPIHELSKSMNDLKDDRSRKVSVMIYGSTENIRQLMEMARPMKREEGIAFYGSVPHMHASLIVSIIKEVFLKGSSKIKEEVNVRKRIIINEDIPIIKIRVRKKSRYFEEEY
jgi:hypothetical protein